MPSAIPTRKHPVHPTLLKGRQNSTIHELRVPQINDQTLAILQGGRKKGAGENAATRLQNERVHKLSQTISLQQPESQSLQRNQQLPQGHRNQRSQGRSDQRRKRKAEEQINPRPARKRAIAQLKDEAYMRRTLRIPTSQEYPDLPHDFFKTVKVSIFNAVQGLAELRSEFRTLEKDANQCTLRFSSVARNEVVVGEGRTNVSFPYFL